MKISFIKYNSFLVAFYSYFYVFTRIFQIFDLNDNYKYFLLLSLCPIIFEIKNLNFKFLKIIFVFLIIILINLSLTKASLGQIIFHIKDIFYGISAGIIGSLKIKKSYLEKNIKVFSYVNILVHSYIIFFNRSIYYEKMDYMVFGYAILQSTIFLIYILLKSKKKSAIDFLVTIYSLIIILLFGNRFALLIGFISCLILYWYYEKNKLKKFIMYFIMLISFVFLYLNLKIILIYLNDIFIKMNYKVYGIIRLIESLNLKERSGDITSGRMNIYMEAIEIIRKNLFGIGIWGYLFEVKSKWLALGYYPHNVFIEIGMHWGIIGLILFIFFLIKIGYKILKLPNSNYKFFLIALLLLNLKLLVSDTYIAYKMFWLFFAVYFNNSYKEE